MKPKLSVIMPVYNAQKFLKESIESILNQTFKDFEFIIINDKSTDNSLSIIQSYTDTRIKIIQNENRLGVACSLNEGIKNARGDFIIRMDSDDISLPMRIEKLVACIQAYPEIDVLSSRVDMVNQEGNYLNSLWDADLKKINHAQIVQYLPFRNCIAHPSVMIRTSLLKENLYDPKAKNAEDYELWLRFMLLGKVFYKLNEPLLKYRIHSESVTQLVNNNYLNVLRSVVNAKVICIKKNFRLSFLKVGYWQIIGCLFLDLAIFIFFYIKNFLKVKMDSI